MKLDYIKLVNYAGLYRGSNLKILEIDFSKQKHNICFIVGKNKSGKSTLLNALHPLPDSNNNILSGMQGEKHLIYNMDNGERIKLSIIHPINNKGERTTTKASFKKLVDEDFVELNLNGNIGSYKELVESYFGLDSNFLALSKLSTEDKGIVDKSPLERKKFVTSILDNLEVYNNIGKTMTKRVSTLKAMLNSINSKIQTVGNRSNIELNINNVSNKINILKEQRMLLVKEQSKYETLIDTLDPDKTIVNSYSNLINQLSKINSDIALAENSFGVSIEYNSIDKIKNELLDKSKNLNISLNKYNLEMDNLDMVMPDLLAEHEEQSRSIELKTRRLDALHSETNYNDLLNTFNKDSSTIKEYEKIFASMNISEPLSISKDEYIIALNTLKEIKESLDNLRSGEISRDLILTAMNYTIMNQNAYSEKNTIEQKIREHESKLYELHIKITEYESKLATLEILTNRPKECKVNTCSFIADALKIEKENPEKHLIELGIEVDKHENDICDLNNELSYIEDIIHYTNYLRVIKRDIDNNKELLAKLPHYSEHFSSLEQLVDKCINGEDFSIMESIYNTIVNANIFDSYKILKNKLERITSELKIYETKNQIIEELNNDIKELSKKTDKTIVKLNEITERKKTLYSLIDDINKNISNYKLLMDSIEKLEILYKKKEDFEKDIKLIEEDSEKIKKLIINVNNVSSKINIIDQELNPLEKQKNKLEYNLMMLDSYEKEYNEYSARYTKSEKIRYYSVPKTGIQLIFMDMYMHKAIRMCNELLEYFFNGDLMLTDYILDYNEFRLPCYDKPSGITNSDVSYCSSSEKCMIGMIMSYVLLNQSASDYNILRMDEIDSGLDQTNKLNFSPTAKMLMDILKVQQCFMISHSSENEYTDVDVIQLAQGTKLSNDINGANIIYSI